PTACSCGPTVSTCGSRRRERRSSGRAYLSRAAAGVRSQAVDRALHRRYQSFHGGHQRLEGLKRVGQVCIAVRDTQHTDAKDLLSFFDVSRRSEAALRMHAGRFVIVPLPNVSHVCYGRDVGDVVERIVLDEPTQALSASETRKKAGLV